MNIMRPSGYFGRRAQRLQSVIVFRRLLWGDPDIVTGQVDVLPAERREMRQQVIGDIFRLAQGGDGTFEVSCVPQNDRGDDEVQPGSAVLLVLVGAIADFAEPMDKDGTRQAVAGFALVQFLAGLVPQFGILNPVEGKQRALQPPSSRSAAATPFWRGYEASCRMMTEGATVPARMEATMRRISAQWARISSTLIRPAMSGSRVG